MLAGSTNCPQSVTIIFYGATVRHISLLSAAKGDKVVIAQTAPAVRVAIGEEFDLPAGTATTGQMVATLKKLGFDYVFGESLAACGWPLYISSCWQVSLTPKQFRCTGHLGVRNGWNSRCADRLGVTTGQCRCLEQP